MVAQRYLGTVSSFRDQRLSSARFSRATCNAGPRARTAPRNCILSPDTGVFESPLRNNFSFPQDFGLIRFMQTLPYLIIALAFSLYFAPSIVAVVREHHQTGAIFLVNLFLGWTFLGWVIALVWSATASTGGLGFKTCPKCAEQVQKAARVCRHCGFEFVQKVSHKKISGDSI